MMVLFFTYNPVLKLFLSNLPSHACHHATMLNTYLLLLVITNFITSLLLLYLLLLIITDILYNI